MQQRVENVARAKKEQEYRNQVMIKKIKMSWERMNRMKEIKEAIQVDRGARRKREIIERHKWRDNTILQRSILPGRTDATIINKIWRITHSECKMGEV